MTSVKPNVNLALELTWLLLLAALWGSSYLFIKLALRDLPPISLITLRCTLAALFLFTVMRWRGESLPADPAIRRRLFLLSIFNSTGAWTLLAWGQQYIDSGLASVLNSTSPIFVFLITTGLSRHEPVSGLKLLGAVVGISGVMLIVGIDALQTLGQHIAGQLAVLAGAMLYAIAAIYGQRFSHLPATVAATGSMLWGAVVLVPASLILERPWTLTPSTQALAAALILAVLCTGVALLIYFRLLKTLGSMGVASQSYLRAGIGVGLGIIFLGEQISLAVGLGIVAAILGVVAINYPLPK